MTRYCDIVMKGGITSGVVYPLAIHELSNHYQFRNIGGTSAGAIAAAGAAAAEYGRQHGNARSFDQLAELPTDLETRIPSLFRPSESTEPLFRVFAAPAKAKGTRSKITRTAIAAARGFPLAGLLGLALPLVLGVTSAIAGGAVGWLWVGVSALLAVLFAAIAIVVAVVRRFVRVVPENYYGLCSGQGAREADGKEPLTPWLADLLDSLAGKPPDKPLTFGDFRGDRADREPEINLEMVTTCLTQGRPYRLPFDNNEFWFKPEELRDLFPERIVDWMVAHPGESNGDESFEGYIKLPRADDLPVVFAARLSLSFPFLISAVPLHAIDYSTKVKKPERCWFSDGGITSNFPVHFFDSPVPRWPTFAINLRPFHRCHPRDAKTECNNVWMPKTNQTRKEWWTVWDNRKGFRKLSGFCASIAQTTRNWRDNAQASIPGYGDRIVHISHTDQEGGLNLYMSKKVIESLSERGRCAGELLHRRFSVPPIEPTRLTWDNQRWVRYRLFMRLLEKSGKQLQVGCRGLAPDKPIEELSRRGEHEPPESYRWVNHGQRDFAVKATFDLLHLFESWEGASESFAERAPEAATDLRVVPHV
jgi:predicted acylesterase/phospholipase RssA